MSRSFACVALAALTISSSAFAATDVLISLQVGRNGEGTSEYFNATVGAYYGANYDYSPLLNGPIGAPEGNRFDTFDALRSQMMDHPWTLTMYPGSPQEKTVQLNLDTFLITVGDLPRVTLTSPVDGGTYSNLQSVSFTTTAGGDMGMVSAIERAGDYWSKSQYFDPSLRNVDLGVTSLAPDPYLVQVLLFTSGNYDNSLSTMSVVGNDGTYNLNVATSTSRADAAYITIVPEPGAITLIAGGLLMLTRRRFGRGKN